MSSIFKDSAIQIGNISVYIQNADSYFAEAYYLYSQIVRNHTSQILGLKNVLQNTKSSKRVLAIKNIIEAKEYNLESLRQIIQILKPLVKPEHLVSINPNPNDNVVDYLKDYHYLRRDWAGESKNEKQLRVVCEKLSEVIREKKDLATALFLGAGVARIPYDLSDYFDEIYATDKSFSMVWHFHEICERELSFYEINSKNVATVSDHTDLLKVSIRKFEKNWEKKLEKLNYFVSDVLNQPFKDDSISAVFSIFFTDVIALKLWLPEVKRILKDGGSFIHLGPLDYFFSDQREMLTCEEVREVFEENGFVVTKDEFFETTHLASSRAMSNKTYTNWLFAAEIQKKESDKINHSSVLKIKEKASYSINGNITSKGYETFTQLHMPDGTSYEGAETVVDILKLIDGKRSIQDILNEMTSVFGDEVEEQKESILKILESLVAKGVLKIH